MITDKAKGDFTSVNDEATNPASTNPPLGIVVAVALISAVVMGFEISLTRVFAVLLRYHFAFLVISIALCGLGVGGFAAYWFRRWRRINLGAIAICFAISIDLAMAGMLQGVFANFPQAYWAAGAIVLVPFSLAGVFLAECFTSYSQSSGKLYAWDLAGASLATILTVGLLQVVSAIDTCLALASLSAAAALILPKTNSAKSTLPRIIAVVVLIFVFAADSAAHFLDIPAIPPHFDSQHRSLADIGLTQELFTELGTPGHTSKIIDTRWDAFARTDIVRDSVAPQTLVVYMNGSVPTNMIAWDGSLSHVPPLNRWFPLSDYAFSVAPLSNPGKPPHGRVLSIGPGGGLDALLALTHGAERFDGAELNPAILPIMRDYAQFNGGIYNQANVHVHTAEGRAFVRDAISHGTHYDLIYSALTKTATAGQGTALLESFVYTTDAVKDYLGALSDNGELVLVTDNPLLTMRFAVSAIAVLKSEGISEADACKHLCLVMDLHPGPYRFEMIFQKSPFSPEETEILSQQASIHGIQTIWIPGVVANDTYGPITELGSGKITLAQFTDWYRSPANAGFAYDLAPCGDDRPYFLDLTIGIQPVFKQLIAFSGGLGLMIAFLGWATSRSDRFKAETKTNPLPFAAFLTYIAYFCTLGVGFMLIEIPVAEKLILPLGYPTLALTVILFSVLAGGGLGAWVSQQKPESILMRWTVCAALAIAVCAAVGGIALDHFADIVLGLNLILKCAIAALLLLPLGFLLGVPFPSGIRLFAVREHDQVALIWGLNGVASVVGSLCAASFSKAWGYDIALDLGAVMYCLAAALLPLANSIASKRQAAVEPVSQT